MTNEERISLVKDSTLTESSIKNALIYLLEKDNENDTVNGLRIKNLPLGNTESFVQTSDLWITFTNSTQCKVLSYLGTGDPADPSNYEYITSFDLVTP